MMIIRIETRESNGDSRRLPTMVAVKRRAASLGKSKTSTKVRNSFSASSLRSPSQDFIISGPQFGGATLEIALQCY